MEPAVAQPALLCDADRSRDGGGGCGLVRLDPPPDPQELARFYPRNYWFTPEQSAAGRAEEAYRRLVLRDHVRFVECALRQSPARGPLLDVGCGGGLFLGMMR